MLNFLFLEKFRIILKYQIIAQSLRILSNSNRLLILHFSGRKTAPSYDCKNEKYLFIKKESVMRALSFIIIILISNITFAADQLAMIHPNLEIKGDENLISKMVFKQNMTDFGEVNFGEQYTHFFEFVNEGNATLKIEDAFAKSENAEVFSFSPTIEPGKSGWIRVKFESKLSIGKFEEYFFIRSNSGGKKTLSRVKIKYELFEYLAIGGDNVEATDKINIREQPQLDSPVIFTLTQGETCKILDDGIGDYVEKFDDSFWFKVESEGRVGWILSALTEF